jgi:SAM-dependent methyltransferase
MVFYQPTPAHIVLALVDKANIGSQDVFYDLGSGLGQVCILVNLLTGVKSKGVEFEPAFCDYARQCASRLNVSNVEFINQDARDTDYADGTIFFMYTPFKDKLLDQVLQKLESEAQKHSIRICTFGSCSQTVLRQSWLKCVQQDFAGDHEFAIFEVREAWEKRK